MAKSRKPKGASSKSVKDAVSEASEKGEEIAEAVFEDVNDSVADSVSEKAEEISDSVADAADGATETVEELKDSVASEAEDALSDTPSADLSSDDALTVAEERLDAADAEAVMVGEEIPGDAGADSFAAAAPPPPEPQTVYVTKKAGFLPLFLGGLLAAVLGFMAARMNVLDSILPESMRAEQVPDLTQPLERAQTEVNELRGLVESLTAQVGDLDGRASGVETETTSLGEQLSNQGTQLTDLTTQLGDLGGQLTGVSEQVGAVEAELETVGGGLTEQGGQMSEIADRVAFLETIPRETPEGDIILPGMPLNLKTRLEELESRPIFDPDVDPFAEERTEFVTLKETTETQQTRMDELQTSVETQRNEITSFLGEATATLGSLQTRSNEQQTEISTLLSDAKAAEEAAEAAANLAQARAAMTEITAAIGSGAPFGSAVEALKETGQVDVPEGFAELGADGVPTLAAIQGGAASAARSALAAARSASRGDEGVGGFFQRQMGFRSVGPREGDDPDAVLSRVEAAVKSSDFDTALSEADALPDDAKAAMSDWLDGLRRHSEASAAADALNKRLSSM